MIIVIDAYNLLRAAPPYKKTISDQERVRFIAQLGLYGRRKGHKIVLIFDGGLHDWPLRETIKNVQIIYSGIHESADDYIKEYLDAHRTQDLLLVSSDTELNQCAERLNISSIDSVVFQQLVYQELQKTSHDKNQQDAVKLDQESVTDIDELMIQASKYVPVKSEDVAPLDKKRSSKKDTVAKHERALLKKLNKL